MKDTPLLGTLALALLFAASPAKAALIEWTDNGVTWSSGDGTPTYYNPSINADANLYDKLPVGPGTSPVWTVYSKTGEVSTATVTGDYLEISTDTLSTNAYTSNSGWSFDNLTFETRFRIDSQDSPYYVAGLFMEASGKGLSLSFTPNSIIQFGTTLVGGLDLTQWTTLRVTITGGATPTVSLYINQNPIAVYTSSDIFYSASRTLIGFGDSSTSAEGGTVQWDYLRWTDTGAYAPIPEPGAYALLATASALCLGWRRWRA